MIKINKKSKLGLLLLAALGVVVAAVCLIPKEDNGVLRELREKSGYIRTVEAKEYEFFRSLVIRDSAEELSETELDVKTREIINRSNAEFLLGNQMGLCKPYSFASFQLDMENENTQRRIKKQNNEVFYGPEQFDLITYYRYISGNLKLDMVSFIVQNVDQEIQKGAKAYFADHRDNYRTIEKIEYSLCENGVTESKTVLYEDFSTLEKTDSQLFEFLYVGKEGDQFEYIYQKQPRTVEITAVIYKKLTYKNNAERVMRDYVTNVYLDDWLQEIEENYPTEINL